MVTGILFLAVLFLKGIYPFGAGRIDYYDMGQTNAPLYYHLWDFLHGRGGLFYSFFPNEGQNLAMAGAVQWNISPFNLFFLFVKRELILESLSLFMGLRLIFMSFFCAIFLRELDTGLPLWLKTLLPVSYGLCGYTLTHYTIPTYLDMAAFFPLLMLALLRLMRSGRGGFFALMLGFTTALSYYLGFMNLIFVLLASGVWLLFIVPKEDRGERILSLGVSTFIGIMISMPLLLPAVLEMSHSSRFNSNLAGGFGETIISILSSIGADEYYVKYWQLFGMELCLGLIWIGAWKVFVNSRPLKTAAAALIIPFFPCSMIILESVNILFHFGTYYHYPIRCAYLIPFTLISSAAYFAGEVFNGDFYWEELDADALDETALTSREASLESKLALHSKAGILGRTLFFRGCVWIGAVACVCITSFFLYNIIYLRHEIWDVRELFWAWVPCFIFLLALFGIGLMARAPKALLFGLGLAELFLGALIAYGGEPHFKDRFFSDPEQSGDYIVASEGLSRAFGEELRSENPLIRLKNPDTELNTNYGMVLRRGTVTGWANTLTGTQMKSAEKMGYGTHFMRILDSGGTAFMDSLLGVRDLITCVPELYEKDSCEDVYGLKSQRSGINGNGASSDSFKGNEWHLIENRAAFPTVYSVNGTLLDIDTSEMDPIEIHETFYRLLTEGGSLREEALDSGDLGLKGSESSPKEAPLLSEIGRGSGKYLLSKRSLLYLIKGEAERIRVDGETVPVPTIGDMGNTAYPAWFNSSMLFLGGHEAGMVEIEAGKKSRIYALDIERLLELSKGLEAFAGEAQAGLSSLNIKIEGTADRGYCLIPLHADAGWRAEVNGTQRELRDVAGVLTAVPLDPGENLIRMRFVPEGLDFGIIISLAGVLILACMNRKKASHGVTKAFTIGFWPIWGLAVLCFYAVPYIFAGIRMIIKRFGG